MKTLSIKKLTEILSMYFQGVKDTSLSMGTIYLSGRGPESIMFCMFTEVETKAI